MKCVMVMFDSLNRHHLAPYGCGWTHTPNFARLARRTATFDASYVCSMPCMPARRDLHTGRPNFLHRSWGPLEPFDDSAFDILGKNGVYSHLVTDHYHYFEAGGATYHLPYSTWEFFRGQEGDPWVGRAGDVPLPPDVLPESRAGRGERYGRQDLLNRSAWADDDAARPMARTFRAGVEFVRRNAAEDRWVVQIETFDPHEPFDAPRRAKDHFAAHYDGYDAGRFDWPIYDYASAQATPEQVEHCRHEYAALLAECDAKLGDVLDVFDELDLWGDTMLVVWTDHGFFLGERDCMGKMWLPWWDTIARTPFFVHDPRAPGAAGSRRSALVQPSIDLGPTLLEFFGVAPTKDMTGRSIRPAVESDAAIREAGIFGTFGQQANVTDGRHVYLHPASGPRPPEYTLMPTAMRHAFPTRKFSADVEMVGPLPFTKDARVMRIPDAVLLGRAGTQHPDKQRALLYDTAADPAQERPIDDPATRDRLVGHLCRLMAESAAPPEAYDRLELPRP